MEVFGLANRPMEARLPAVGTGVKVSPWSENPTRRQKSCLNIFNHLQTATGLQYKKADEVARNGVLQRITSARGFL